jgi:uncharacterized RDD family membrane protein YckC
MEYISVGRRAVAIIVDSIVLWIAFFVILAVTGDSTTTRTNGGFEFEASGGGLSVALILLVGIGYFIVLEKVLGATLGKLLVGIRVVMDGGPELSWGASVARNLLRVVDGLFVYLVGAIIVWNSPTRQRLGDKVAKTFVVSKASVGMSPAAAGGSPPPPPPPPV